MLKNIKKSLKELNFSENEILVYLTLTQLGESVASNIAKKADLPRTTTIGILEKLRVNNYLTTHKYRGSTYYWIESPKAIKNNYLAKIKIAEDLDKHLSDLYRTEADFPYAKVYDTQSGIKKFIEKTINSVPKGTVFYTIDSATKGNYSKIYSKNYIDILIEMKKQKAIKTKTLVPFNTYREINPEKIAKQNIEIREMPEKIQFLSSIWIIEDMLVHFSGKYPFIVAINHKIITSSIKSIYDFLWKVSEKMN